MLDNREHLAAQLAGYFINKARLRYPEAKEETIAAEALAQLAWLAIRYMEKSGYSLARLDVLLTSMRTKAEAEHALKNNDGGTDVRSDKTRESDADRGG